MQPLVRRAGMLILATWFVLSGSAFAEEKVEVKVAKYADLANMIKKLKGKVVVIDFWADW